MEKATEQIGFYVELLGASALYFLVLAVLALTFFWGFSKKKQQPLQSKSEIETDTDNVHALAKSVQSPGDYEECITTIRAFEAKWESRGAAGNILQGITDRLRDVADEAFDQSQAIRLHQLQYQLS